MSLWERIMYNFKGLDKLAIEELQKRVGELEKVSGNFAGLEQEVIKLSGEFTGNFKELLGKFDGLNDKFDGLQEKLTGLQENFTGLEEKVKTLTEAVADQEKIMATCIIVSAVAAIAVASFVAFCIYQGVKCEREKEKNLSKDTPDTKLNDKVDTQAQQNSLGMGVLNKLCQTAFLVQLNFQSARKENIKLRDS